MSNLFENVNIESLPQLISTDFLPLERKYRAFMILRNSLIFLGLAVVVSVISYILIDKIDIIIIAIPFIAIVLLYSFSMFIVYKGFDKKGYLLRKHDLSYKSGFLFQHQISIPKNRIQHIEIRQGILLRMFKLSKLIVYTAGGSGSDLSISGLNPNTAKQLKEEISLNISVHE